MRSEKITFIEQVRREQIIAATIDELAEHGFVNTSLASIGERIGAGKSLIAYHFHDKNSLLTAVVASISGERMAVIDKAVAHADAPREKLIAMLKSDIEHLCSNPQKFRALTEISFHRYSGSGSIQFLGDNELLVFPKLIRLLEHVFGPEKDVSSLAVVLDGSRDSFLARYSHGDRSIEPKVFVQQLIAIIDHNKKGKDYA